MCAAKDEPLMASTAERGPRLTAQAWTDALHLLDEAQRIQGARRADLGASRWTALYEPQQHFENTLRIALLLAAGDAPEPILDHLTRETV